MDAVDTNVLLYAHDPRDAAKQATAASLLSSLTDGVLLWQVACARPAHAPALLAKLSLTISKSSEI